MSELHVRVVKNITKEYPEMYKIVIYKQPKFFIKTDSIKRKREQVSEDYVPKISSLNRTKTLVRDIILCNNFEYFCTFTFNPAKIDSFKISSCWRAMSSWLHNQRNKSREKGIDFKYLVIPEQHKSGRWHFHALISGYTSTLKATKSFSPSLRPIFNITSFRSGFTTAVPIDSKQAVSSYVTKYITKDFVTMFNQRRFFASRNLERPAKKINSDVISFTLPLFRKFVGENSETQEFIIDKKDFPLYHGVSTRQMSHNIDFKTLGF